jgi:hypothetical protein
MTGFLLEQRRRAFACVGRLRSRCNLNFKVIARLNLLRLAPCIALGTTKEHSKNTVTHWPPDAGRRVPPPVAVDPPA